MSFTEGWQKVTNQYKPDYVSPPGETLLEIMEERQISRPGLARVLGFPLYLLNQIIEGKSPITPEIARHLERVLNRPTAEYWLRREQLYQESIQGTSDQ